MVPANMMAMMKKNEQIHVQAWPSCFPQEEHLFSNYPLETGRKSYSIINQVYSVVASQIYTEQMRDMLCTTEKQREIMHPGYGMTMIVDPAGHVMSSVPRDEEGISLCGKVDLTLLIGGKVPVRSGRPLLQSSLRLVIDENPRQPVTIVGKADDQSICYEELKRWQNSTDMLECG